MSSSAAMNNKSTTRKMTSGFGVGITSATPNQQTKMTTTAGVPTTATTTQQSSSRRENNNRKKKKHIVTPTAKTSLDHRMSVDKNIIDELLLVCGVIGTTTNAGNDLVPVTDCLNWLQDLQRALRRDEDLYRPISLLIGKWKVVEQKLIPLVMTCRYDTPIVLTVVKILVILTKPLADNTKRAGQMIIDTMSNKSDPDVVAQQIKLRDNALAQAEQLMEYKRHVTFHSSHRQGASDQNRRISSTGGGTGLFSIIVSLLAEPLSKSGASRTDADHLTIELVLHLIRNLLATEPLLNISSDTSRQAALLHQEMIALFERELVLEIILVVGQEMELRENAQYNLLMMEILHHIVKAQDPSAVAKCMIKSSSSASDTSTTAGATKNNPVASNRFSTSSSILASKLKQEQAQRRNMSTVRHGHFGGTWMRQQADGKRQFVGASAIVQNSVGSQLQRQVQARRRNRMAEPFIGSSKTLLAHTRLPMADCGPATKRANATLNKFCQRFMADCYGPFMKSLKNEFRRDSVRLEEGDKVVFFKLIWFFAQWWRVSSQSQGRAQNSNDNKEAIGRLIITMDVFTFNLVLNATDSFFQHKKHTRLAHAVALYCEMMHLLYEMYTSKDNTEHEMAIGLIDRLFYGQEALDRLPKLLSRWTPGTYTREYLCNLVEVAHMSVKLLEANHKMGAEHMKSIKSASTDKSISNKISKMMSVAAEFDIKTYLLRKVVSNQMITMYVHLLAQYKTNATLVNHRIIAMFLRLMRLEIALPEVADADIPLNPLGTKRVTIEPMLYNLQLIMVLEQVLNDLSIRREKSFEPLLQFSTNLMYNFWSAADANPMLYVECLFRHPVPHRFCESVTNMYVSDELRMLAEREILREDQFLLEADEGDAEIPGEDDDDDEELEFTGDNVQAGTDSSGEPLSSDDSPNVDDEEKRESEIKDSNREEPSAGYDAMDDRIDTERKRARNDDSEKLNKEPASKIPRTGRAVEDDDSDDDFEFGTSNEEIPFAGKQNQAKTKQKYAIEDEDSDDE